MTTRQQKKAAQRNVRSQQKTDGAAIRVDGPYENVFLGMGRLNDRSNYTQIAPASLDHITLSNIYAYDGLARRIIDIQADDMVRAGWDIDGIEEDTEKKVCVLFESLKVKTQLADAVRWSLLFGGSLILMLVNDGGQLVDPVNPESIKTVERLKVFNRWEVSRNQKYKDPKNPKYGDTEFYMISAENIPAFVVHESRCIVLDGLPVPSWIRSLNDYWGGSRMQACYDQLVRLGMAQKWVNSLLERAQQAVHSIPELTVALRSKEGEENVIKRVNLVDMARSINNTIVIDGAESYDLKSTSFASIPDCVDRLSLALCAASGIPESILFGTQYGGLQGAASADKQTWQAKISQAQEAQLKPALDRIITLVLHSLGVKDQKYTIEFCALEKPDELKQTENKYKQAQTLDILQTLGAVDQAEARELAPEIAEGLEEIRAKMELEQTTDPSKAAQLAAEIEEGDQ